MTGEGSPNYTLTVQLISCHDGRLLTLDSTRLGNSSGRSFRTGLEALDALAPGGAFARGAVHELLADRKEGTPLFAAMLLASASAPLAASRISERPLIREAASGVIIWCDPHHELYPPALTPHGIDLKRLYLLRAKPADLTWAITECLRCKGVGAVVAPVQKLSRLEARRLQLAAEQGGGMGILLRPTGPGSEIYAAATRWLVRPAPGERTLQRWTVQLIHGHGGRIGKTVTLECSRENHLVRASEQLADRPGAEESRERAVARAG